MLTNDHVSFAGNAKIAGITEDLNITESEYNVALSIFFIGYVSTLYMHIAILLLQQPYSCYTTKIIFEIPSNLMLKRVGPNAWIPLVMISFGIVLACMSAVSNGSGLLATRFFLGIAEAGLFPVSPDDASFCGQGLTRGRVSSFILHYGILAENKQHALQSFSDGQLSLV